MERCRKKRGSLTRFPFQSGGIRVHNDPTPLPPQGQHIPPLSPNPVRFYGLSIDRSVAVRRARSTDQRLSYQRNQLTINQELASSAFPSPFSSASLPLPLSLFSASENASLARLPQSCKYDGAPSVLSRGAERVSMAHLVSIRVLLFVPH